MSFRWGRELTFGGVCVWGGKGRGGEEESTGGGGGGGIFLGGVNQHSVAALKLKGKSYFLSSSHTHSNKHIFWL